MADVFTPIDLKMAVVTNILIIADVAKAETSNRESSHTMTLLTQKSHRCQVCEYSMFGEFVLTLNPSAGQ